MNRKCLSLAGLAFGVVAGSAAADTALAPLSCVEAEPGAIFSAAPLGQDETVVALSAMQDEAPAKEWVGTFFFGLSAASGNSENLGGSVAATLKRENDRHRTNIFADYYYNSNDGDRDQNRFTLGARHDWLLPGSKWFFFAQAIGDVDEFQSWDERLALHGGVGYALVERDNYTFNLRAGLGTLREWGSDDDDWKFEGLFGFDLVWDITDKQQFVMGSTYYPDFSDTSEYRTLSYAGWTAEIDDDSGMSVNARVEHEYQSEIDSGRDHNDFRFAAGISFGF